MHKTERITIVSKGELLLCMTLCDMNRAAIRSKIHRDLTIEDARIAFDSDVCFCDEKPDVCCSCGLYRLRDIDRAFSSDGTSHMAESCVKLTED